MRLFSPPELPTCAFLCLPADVIQSAFYNLSSANSTVELQEFVDVYFDKPGTEFRLWTPLDWHEK